MGHEDDMPTRDSDPEKPQEPSSVNISRTEANMARMERIRRENNEKAGQLLNGFEKLLLSIPPQFQRGGVPVTRNEIIKKIVEVLLTPQTKTQFPDFQSISRGPNPEITNYREKTGELHYQLYDKSNPEVRGIFNAGMLDLPEVKEALQEEEAKDNS